MTSNNNVSLLITRMEDTLALLITPIYYESSIVKTTGTSEGKVKGIQTKHLSMTMNEAPQKRGSVFCDTALHNDKVMSSFQSSSGHLYIESDEKNIIIAFHWQTMLEIL
jgi:hypothetical protein